MKLNLTVDEVLSTTRAVRKRLDLTKKVPREVIEECLELAMQAPNGSNQNKWRWMIVDDPAKIAKLGEFYAAIVEQHSAAMTASNTGIPGEAKVIDGAIAFSKVFSQVPAILIPLMAGRPDGKPIAGQAGMWGSILPATWAFMLALRERGLGSAWTTAGLMREKEAAQLLGIPYDSYAQAGWFPIGYTIGTDFKKAWRKPVSEVLSYNAFKG